ncbi:MAG: ATP-binding protein [Dongiaceae bacterium]
MRFRLLLAVLLSASVSAAAAAWYIAFQDGMARLGADLDGGLSLAAGTVATEADRFRYLPSVVGQDERIGRLLRAPDDAAVDVANRYLEVVSTAAGTHDLFVMNAAGLTLASSNWREPDSRVGKSYWFRNYFKDAMRDGEGRYYAIGATSGIPGYYIARRIDAAGPAIGVAVAKVDLSPLEKSWSASGGRVGLVDAAGMIFLSDIPAWKYRPLQPLRPEDRERLRGERQYLPEYLDRPPLLAGHDLQPGRDAFLSLAGDPMLGRIVAVPGHEWRLFAAAATAPVYGAAFRDAALVLLAAALLVLAGSYLLARRARTAELVRLTERLKAALEQAAEANLAKSRFLNAVHHDMRNPLNTILGFAGLVLEKAGEQLPPVQRDNLKKLCGQGQELNDLIASLIDYASEDRLKCGWFSLAPLVEACCATIEPLVQRNGIRLACELLPDLPPLLQDYDKLRRVLRNLLTNAEKYTDQGSITVTARRRDDHVEILVADTGIGIDPADQARIFQEFERVEAHRREGTGLGLAICRQFAQRMGGAISVESRPGVGTVFTLTLPIVHPMAHAGRAGPAPGMAA